ncbi:MAG: sugar transferase [Eubacterium sp.]|nr:sugar transferase [Eubacterium sp.]
MNKRGHAQFWIEFLFDVVCLTIANITSFLIFRFAFPKIAIYPPSEWARYFIALFVAFVTVFVGFYSTIDIKRRDRRREIISILSNSSLTYLIFSASILLIKSPIIQSRYMLMSSYIIFTLLLFPEKYFLKRWITGFFTKSRNAAMVGIITTSDIANEFVEGIKSDWSLNVTGIILADREFAKVPAGAALGVAESYPKSIADIPVVSADENYMDWVRSAPLDEVFINISSTSDSKLQELVEELEDMGITVHLNIPRLTKMLDESKFDNINCRVYAGYPMATFAATRYSTAELVIKRVFDIFAGLIGCIIALIAMAIVAIPLKKESPGPLIFKQQRVGKNGRLFNIYKIRSMYADAEERKAELIDDNKMDGLMFKIENDPRITKVGSFIRKYSIDELPQFFNVLKGDMSVVGTRPPTIEEFEQYESRHKRRLSMRPGITGMWQVSGRSEITDFEQVVALDCKYIDEWSVGLDMKILIKTVFVVLTHKGAE